ncbi:MAG: hypothetical protein EBR54_05665 [Flavobacteriia bacterium]|nr:hypothetical protein [Flavobacteriia bacterium]NBX38883.1 hypothetical protein [Flavobacteriia bacterium]
MKTIVLALVAAVPLLFCASFRKDHTTKIQLSGDLQYFVNSFKYIESVPLAEKGAFKLGKQNKINEGFQMYTFHFDDKTVEHNYVLSDASGNLDVFNKISKITQIINSDGFAYITVNDESKYYSNTHKKIFIVNLYGNPDYPMISVFWKHHGKMSGAYSIDNNSFEGLIHGNDSGAVFKD